MYDRTSRMNASWSMVAMIDMFAKLHIFFLEMHSEGMLKGFGHTMPSDDYVNGCRNRTLE